MPATHPSGAAVWGVSATDSEPKGGVWAGGTSLSVKSPGELVESLSRAKEGQGLNLALQHLALGKAGECGVDWKGFCDGHSFLGI